MTLRKIKRKSNTRKKNKCLKLRYHVEKGGATFKYMDTKNQLTDTLTKF